MHEQGAETALHDFNTIVTPKPNFASNLLSIVTAQLHQMNLKATKEADCYMHIYFNAFNQRIMLRRSYKASKKKRIIKINWYCIFIGIVLVLLI